MSANKLRSLLFSEDTPYGETVLPKVIEVRLGVGTDEVQAVAAICTVG